MFIGKAVENILYKERFLGDRIQQEFFWPYLPKKSKAKWNENRTKTLQGGSLQKVALLARISGTSPNPVSKDNKCEMPHNNLLMP